jgi:hypothetical protein
MGRVACTGPEVPQLSSSAALASWRPAPNQVEVFFSARYDARTFGGGPMRLESLHRPWLMDRCGVGEQLGGQY